MNSQRFFQAILRQLTADDLFVSSGSLMTLAAKDEVPLPHLLPAAYIIPLEDTAPQSAFSSGMQTITLRFAILQCYAAAQQPSRSQRSLGRLTHILKTRAALIPLIKNTGDDNHHAPDFIKGRLLHFGKGVIWWEDQFITQHTVSQ